MAERDVLHAIREALGQEPDLVLWRNNCGVSTFSRGQRTQRVVYGLAPGSADLVGLLAPGGRFFALEVKTEEGRLSEAQRLWLALVRSKGGFAAVARSVEEARAALARARAGGDS